MNERELDEMARELAEMAGRETKYETTVENGIIKPLDSTDPPPLESYTAKELLAMDLEPPRMIVDNLLPEGICLLSASPKIGKSWLAMDISLSVITGAPVLGFPSNKCNVVYFALEDSWTRLQRRLRKLTGSVIIPEGLTLITKCEPIHRGFLKQLEEQLEANPGTGLVIVDTMQKIMPPSDRAKSAYEQVYGTFTDISRLAFKHHVCVLFLHHNRKSNGFDGDPFEDILGSTALQGATDAMFVIKKKKRTDEEATLYATGRDIDQHELLIKFNQTLCRWENFGAVEDVERSRLEQEYINHPAIRTLKYMLEQIENDPNEFFKAYITTIGGFRNDTLKHTGKVIGTSEKAFSTIIKDFDPYMLRDGIEHIQPRGRTTHKGQKGLFHTFKYTTETYKQV